MCFVVFGFRVNKPMVRAQQCRLYAPQSDESRLHNLHVRVPESAEAAQSWESSTTHPHSPPESASPDLSPQPTLGQHFVCLWTLDSGSVVRHACKFHAGAPC